MRNANGRRNQRELTSDDSAGKAIATIETHAIATGRAVDLNLARVGAELLGRVLGGESALNSKAARGDAVLRQSQLSQRGASGDLNLSGDDVDAGDLLGDGVLDLDTRVDFDEVVAVLLIDEELRSASIAVVDSLGQPDGISQDGIASLGREILRGGDLDNLLVATLDGAVTLVQVNDVSVVIAKQLDLDVLGLVEESLDKDSAVAEGRLGLRGCALEMLLQTLGFANNSHASATTAVSGLDDDGEAIGIRKGLDLLVCGNSPLSAGDDRDVGRDSQLTSRYLVAESVNDIGARADEL